MTATPGMPAFRRLHELIRRVNAGDSVAGTLTAVVDAVVDGLGFGAAVVNYVRDDGTVEVVAVAGPDDLRQTLLGRKADLTAWSRSLEDAQEWGLLRFAPGHGAPAPDEDELPTWVPQPSDASAASPVPQPSDASAASRVPQPSDASAASRVPQPSDASAASRVPPAPETSVASRVPPAPETSAATAPQLPHQRLATETALPWDPMDALYAPLYAPTGELIGVLSVDLPAGGVRPGPATCQLLEMFAVQAGIAIHNAKLTEALRAEREHLRVSEESFRLAFENAPNGTSVIDLAGPRPGRFLRVNAAMCRMLGYSAAQLTALTFADITHPDSRDANVDAMQAALVNGLNGYRTEKLYLRADGTALWVALNTSVVRDENGRALWAISQFEDVTERRARQSELTRWALQDPLTGLPNRAALAQQLSAALDYVRVHGSTGAVLFCDLDGFKAVNDGHGHAVGDQVLTVLAQRIAASVRTGDLVARLGGDEFVVVAEDIDRAQIEDLVTRIQRAVAEPVAVASARVTPWVSIGVAEITPAVRDPDSVLAAADEAMYRAKTGRAPRGYASRPHPGLAQAWA